MDGPAIVQTAPVGAVGPTRMPVRWLLPQRVCGTAQRGVWREFTEVSRSHAGSYVISSVDAVDDLAGNLAHVSIADGAWFTVSASSVWDITPGVDADQDRRELPLVPPAIIKERSTGAPVAAGIGTIVWAGLPAGAQPSARIDVPASVIGSTRAVRRISG